MLLTIRVVVFSVHAAHVTDVHAAVLRTLPRNPSSSLTKAVSSSSMPSTPHWMDNPLRRDDRKMAQAQLPAEIPPEPKTKLDCSLGTVTVMLRMLPFLPENLTGCYSLHNLLGLSSPVGLVREQPLLWKNGNTDAGRQYCRVFSRGWTSLSTTSRKRFPPPCCLHLCPWGSLFPLLWFQFESSPLTVSLTSFMFSPLSS